MNIRKGIDISQLRKIFEDIFGGASGFWISIGGIFFLQIILLLVFISPLSSQYDKAYKSIGDLSTALENYTLKKDLYNDAWITSKKKEADLYDKETEKCKSFLKGRDERLKAFFMIEDREKGLIKVEDVALWKNEYIKRISALAMKLEANHITVSAGALPFQDWKADIPTWDAILPVQKRFWVLEAIVGIVSSHSNGIKKLEKLAFRESAASYDPSCAQFYTPMPLTIKVELPADHIQFLLHDILKSYIPFVIEDVTIVGTGNYFNSGLLNEDGEVLENGQNSRLSNPVIDVTIDAYVIDYKA